tara:strand:+ start:53 stop:316 length:264 start_codon:yes stop_codon:yes gene_type:complete
MQGIIGIDLPSIKVSDHKFTDDWKVVEFERDIELIERDDGIICCDPLAVDYWNESGDQIHPKLEKWADDNGYYWEWETPENIKLYNA